MDESISRKIKHLRVEKGLSQKQIGKLVGVTDRAVSKWENELSSPSIENLYKLSKIFKVPMDFFIDEIKQDSLVTEHNGMDSIRELYKSGRGPSSSHTIAPERACIRFREENKGADGFKVVLYGSLAKTGKGHGTDVVIKKTFAPIKCDVEFDCVQTDIEHPNTLDLIAYKGTSVIGKARVYSIGGGSIRFDNEVQSTHILYSHSTFDEISKHCNEHQIRLWEYVMEVEGADFEEYLSNIWKEMKTSIIKGLSDDGFLPGGLNVKKKAKELYNNQHIDESPEIRENRIVCSYAFAVSEQNASGERVVTAPTCGAAGVLPAVLYYQQKKNNFSDIKIIRALATAGLIGNIIKTNASISGAECGCQAEIGSACAMAAAALAELFELSIDKIEYAAEIAIEHHLGLTCDPICGLVQIPCIERNAVAAMRAINAVNLSSFLWDSRKISLDKVIRTMKETGRDMRVSYKETSEAGLAKISF